MHPQSSMSGHICDSGKNARMKRVPISIPYRLFALVCCLVYGLLLSQIPGDGFKDWHNYLIYAEFSGQRLLVNLQSGLINTLANEPLWLLLNAGLGLLLEPEAVVRAIIFGSAFTVSWLVLRNHPRHALWLLVFLLLPVVIKNHLIHIRQGAAIALFLAGWFSPRPRLRALLMGLSPLIHSSFFFVLLILFLTRLMSRLRLAADIRGIVFIVAGVAVGRVLFWLAALLGARQAEEYQFTATDISGLGFFFWLLVLMIMFMQGQTFLRERAFEIGCVLFYLGTYFFVEVTARIFESSLLLVLLAGLAMTGWRAMSFKGAIIFYGGMIWLMRLGQPALGFGVG